MRRAIGAVADVVLVFPANTNRGWKCATWIVLQATLADQPLGPGGEIQECEEVFHAARDDQQRGVALAGVRRQQRIEFLPESLQHALRIVGFGHREVHLTPHHHRLAGRAQVEARPPPAPASGACRPGRRPFVGMMV